MMDRDLLSRVIRVVAGSYPDVIPHLSESAKNMAGLTAAKTYDYFLTTLQRMVKNLYNGYDTETFIDQMANLVHGQITQAFRQAWNDAELTGPLPDYMTQAADQMALAQGNFIVPFYHDILQSRIDGNPVDPLLARCPLWANRWNEAYNQGTSLIAQKMGGKQVWRLGQTEKHCPTCAALNGIVAYASEWDALGVHPQGAPNQILDCGGWRCDCSLEFTEQRRSPKAYDSILNIVTKV